MTIFDWLDQDFLTMLGTFIIGLISGTASITHRMLSKRKVSKLWWVSEYAGVMLMIALALDTYPMIKPMLIDYGYGWVTEWVYTGILAHSGSRLMYHIEQKITEKIKDHNL